ncbi:MAG: hypothetical protein NTY19_47710 [Planctomycetota bacterium]|nr:hypothetical protein [Planctomycetota bacterium]
MRNLLSVLLFVVLAFLSWGIYGPTLHVGQQKLGIPLQPSSLRAFFCVGLAYFFIAVLVPLAILKFRGEKGRWTLTGMFWSLAGGAAGAIGALGIILAFKFRGSPVYVMPLVFGLAPVVNTFVTMRMAKTFRQASLTFFAGVIVVAIGAGGVLFFQPGTKDIAIKEAGSIKVSLTELVEGVPHEETWTAKDFNELKTKPELEKAYKLYLKAKPLTWGQGLMIPLAIALAALAWGSYGPVLHKGQMKMDGSRLRPFLCVGLAYFVIAVLVPSSLMRIFVEPGSFKFDGVAWALAGGAAGAVGALGIILAFNFGGKPIYVMPLVFGGAPVVNTLTTILSEGNLQAVGPFFLASLLLVIGGAVTVLIFAPRGGKHGAEAHSVPAKPTSRPTPKDASPPPADAEHETTSAGMTTHSRSPDAEHEEDVDTLRFEDTQGPRRLES